MGVLSRVARTTRRVAFGGIGVGVVVAGGGFAWQQQVYAVPEENMKAHTGGKTAVVIGGGVVGFATARELCRHGYKVRVLEKFSGAAEGTSKAPAGHISVSAYHSSFASVAFVLNLGIGTFFQDPMHDRVEEPSDLVKNKFVKWSTWADWNFIAWGLSWLSCTWYASADAPLMSMIKTKRVLDMKQALLQTAKEEGLVGKSGLVENGGRLNVAMHTFHASGFGMRPREYNKESERLNAAGTVQKEPSLGPAFDDGLIRGSYFATKDAYASCYAFTQGLAKRVKDHYGATVDYNTQVMKLETVTKDGVASMAGVRLSTGELVSADVYVLAAGYETPELALTAGVHVPITSMRGYKVCAPVKAASAMPKTAICCKPYELYVTPMHAEKEVHFASYGEFAPRWDKEPTKDLETRLESMVKLVFPQVEEMVDWSRRYHVWGSRPQTADGSPVVGPTAVSGLYINAGHCSYGFRGAFYCAQLLTNGLRNGFESNGIYHRLCSLSRFQPYRPDWPESCLITTNSPPAAELAKDRRK